MVKNRYNDVMMYNDRKNICLNMTVLRKLLDVLQGQLEMIGQNGYSHNLRFNMM